MAGDFVDLLSWQEAVGLTADIARLAQDVRGLGSANVANQMLRAAESIPANVAEGYGRGLGRDFARFLRMAGASAAELESHLRVAAAVGRLNEQQIAAPLARCRRLRALLRGLAISVGSRAPVRAE